MVSSLDLQALNIFLNGPITHDMIHKLVVATLQVIPCKDTKSQTYTTTNNTVKQLPSLMTFLTKLIKYTNVYTGTLMATLVFLQKLKDKLPQNAQGLPCTRHRILLSCLILSSKFHNDSSPKNKHWAKYTDGLFNVKDINLMERQLIYLLNWDLRVDNEEMCHLLGSFLDPIKSQIIKSEKLKLWRKQQQQQQQQQLLEQEAQKKANLLHLKPVSPTTASSIYPSPTSSRPNSCSPHQQQQTLNINQKPQQQINQFVHYRQDSTSSISSVSTTNSQTDASIFSSSSQRSSVSSSTSTNSIPMIMETKPQPPPPAHTLTMVDPIIEFTAMKEEIELNNLLKKFGSSNLNLNRV
ncbi:uncharacterized protein LODBEIA_P56400 [Lodderomyces beijingensis]|uniref:Cyclin N-terminal domain-containing protein n=1 Tax=Lodderomyces beijingensis TaxID=1775926 RepID=A0ABP0ZVU7_9ASCO